jgi:hypothetical protein
LKQANGLDLGKLLLAYHIYWSASCRHLFPDQQTDSFGAEVIHDKISVTEASVELDALMLSPPRYKLWQHLIIGGLASAFIQPSGAYDLIQGFQGDLTRLPLVQPSTVVLSIVSWRSRLDHSSSSSRFLYQGTTCTRVCSSAFFFWREL